MDEITKMFKADLSPDQISGRLKVKHPAVQEKQVSDSTVYKHLYEAFQQFARVTGADDRGRHLAHAILVQGRIECRVSEHLVKVAKGNGISMALVFHDVGALEYQVDVFLGYNAGRLFDDNDIDPQEFRGELVFFLKFERVLVLLQFQSQGLGQR
jgi:hypothetical protein